MSADILLSRLTGMRERGPGKWSARCPAHEDKAPSLSVRELADGKLLVKCFAGCTVDEVVGAVGMDLSDLFPRQLAPGMGDAPLRRRMPLTPLQGLELIAKDAHFAAVTAANQAQGVTLTAADLQALLKAAAHIAYVLDEVKS